MQVLSQKMLEIRKNAELVWPPFLIFYSSLIWMGDISLIHILLFGAYLFILELNSDEVWKLIRRILKYSKIFYSGH
jgi:hypothetical protein